MADERIRTSITLDAAVHARLETLLANTRMLPGLRAQLGESKQAYIERVVVAALADDERRVTEAQQANEAAKAAANNPDQYIDPDPFWAEEG